MSEAKLLLPHSTGGSSGKGISYYKMASKCPRKAQLITERKREGIMGNGSRASRIGTYFHGLANLYYSGVLDDSIIEVSDINYEQDYLEAQRLWAGYLKARPGEQYFGEVLASEINFDGDLMEEKFDVPLSAQMDLVVDMTQEVCDKLEETDNLTLEPGVYIIDHKTKQRKDPNALSSYTRNMQFTGYQLIYQAIKGEDVKGMLANVIISHKEMRAKDLGPRKPRSFQLHHIPYPSEHNEAVFRTWLKNAHELAKTALPLGVGYGCGDYGTCSFYEDGSCDRR